MSKCSPEFQSLAEDCLCQFAQTGNDALSAILTSDDLNAFQASHTGFRARDFPPIKTLTLFMKQVASDSKSCRHTLIDEAKDQVARGNKPIGFGDVGRRQTSEAPLSPWMECILSNVRNVASSSLRVVGDWGE